MMLMLALGMEGNQSFAGQQAPPDHWGLGVDPCVPYLYAARKPMAVMGLTPGKALPAVTFERGREGCGFPTTTIVQAAR